MQVSAGGAALQPFVDVAVMSGTGTHCSRSLRPRMQAFRGAHAPMVRLRCSSGDRGRNASNGRGTSRRPAAARSAHGEAQAAARCHSFPACEHRHLARQGEHRAACGRRDTLQRRAVRRTWSNGWQTSHWRFGWRGQTMVGRARWRAHAGSDVMRGRRGFVQALLLWVGRPPCAKLSPLAVRRQRQAAFGRARWRAYAGSEPMHGRWGLVQALMPWIGRPLCAVSSAPAHGIGLASV